jgi:hypothetical protein
MEIIASEPAKGKIQYGWTVKYFPLEALANLSICHPEHSEGSVFSTAEADPSLRSG